MVEKLFAKASGMGEQACAVEKNKSQMPFWNEERTLPRWHQEILLHMYLTGFLLMPEIFVA